MTYTFAYCLLKTGVEERVFCTSNNIYYVPLNIAENGDVAVKSRDKPDIDRYSILSCLADVYVEELDFRSILKERPKSV